MVAGWYGGGRSNQGRQSSASFIDKIIVGIIMTYPEWSVRLNTGDPLYPPVRAQSVVAAMGASVISWYNSAPAGFRAGLGWERRVKDGHFQLNSTSGLARRLRLSRQMPVYYPKWFMALLYLRYYAISLISLLEPLKTIYIVTFGFYLPWAFAYRLWWGAEVFQPTGRHF